MLCLDKVPRLPISHWLLIRGKTHHARVLTLVALQLVLFHSLSFAQATPKVKGPFQLKGTLVGRDTGKIVLWYPDSSGKWIRDTTYLKSGSFQFQGYINEPSYAHLIGSNRDGNYASFFLEPGTQILSLEENKFDRVKMTGSKTQQEEELLQTQTALLEEARENLMLQCRPLTKVLKTSPDSSEIISVQKKLDSLSDAIGVLNQKHQQLSMEFIQKHPGSFVSPTELLSLLQITTIPLDTVLRLYGKFSLTVKNSRTGQLVLNEIQKHRELNAGNLLADFSTKDVRGRTFSLAGLKGKYVLLDFWGSSCVPCLKAMPEIKQVYAKYQGKGLEVVAISTDRNPVAWKKAIEKEGIGSWTHLLRSEEMAQFKVIQEIPQTLLIDPSSKIIWSSLDQNSQGWAEILSKVLGK